MEHSDFELMLSAAMRLGEVRFRATGRSRVRCTLVLAGSSLRGELTVEREADRARPALREVLDEIATRHE